MGSGLPGLASGPQALRSAFAPARDMKRLVADQSRRGGCLILPWRSSQKIVWSEMSFLIIVLSQSKTANGFVAAGSPWQVPAASIAAWMRAALSPYQVEASWQLRAEPLLRGARPPPQSPTAASTTAHDATRSWRA